MADPQNSQQVDDDRPPEVAIDLTHLRRYTLGDRRLEFEVLKLFIDQVPVTLAALQQAATDRDWIRAAHTLKGSARAVGAWQLANIAERMERLGGLGDQAACDVLLRRIEHAADAARTQIAVLPKVG